MKTNTAPSVRNPRAASDLDDFENAARDSGFLDGEGFFTQTDDDFFLDVHLAPMDSDDLITS